MMLALTGQVTSQLQDFLQTIFGSLGNGGLLLGSFADWQSALLAAIDILVSTVVIYFVLKLFSDSRAWQLLKGFLFILAFTVLCGALGLTTINYVLSNSISVLVIGFVVIFQPELRRALETVGRNSLSLINSVSQEFGDHKVWETQFIEDVVLACTHMARTKTGALIVIERRTSLGEVLEGSPTSVILDANMSATALEQVFYKNSPLHDGALILRDGRLYAARCHVPLADVLHLREEMGTRHRAALGASEIGDAVAIVVSEERGVISVAVSGRIYPMENAEALRAMLCRLFSETMNPQEEMKTLRVRAGQVVQSMRQVFSVSPLHGAKAASSNTSPQQVHKLRRRRIGLQVLSVTIALVLYVYVQVATNPIELATFQNVPISREGLEALDQSGYKMTSSTLTTKVSIRARQNIMERIRKNPHWLNAYIKISEKEEHEGSYALPIQVQINHLHRASYQVVTTDPFEVSAVITKEEAKDQEQLPGLRENIERIHVQPDSASTKR